MKTNHTACPWRWSNEFKTVDGRETLTLLGSDGFGILSCDGNENSPSRESDLALIAAAPELLNALELAQATIERLHRHAPGSANGTLDVIKSAIAKATTTK